MQDGSIEARTRMCELSEDWQAELASDIIVSIALGEV